MQNYLIDPLKNLNSYNKLLEDIQRTVSPISTYGIIDESLGHFVYALKEHSNKQILLITYDEVRARRLYEDIKNFENKNVMYFPKREVLFYDIDAFSYERSNQRLDVLSNLMEDKQLIVVASLDSLLDKILVKSIFQEYTRNIDLDSEIDLQNLIETFVELGYERVAMIEGVGQFSIRGGIIDFFPPNNENPYRLELFDDLIDSIRVFDLLTQRTLENTDKVFIPPVKEILITHKFNAELIVNFEREFKASLEKNKSIVNEEKFNKYLELLQESIYMSNRDMIIPYIPKEYLTSIFDFFRDDALIIMDEPKRIEEKGRNIKKDFIIKYTDLLEVGEALPSHGNIIYDYNELIPKIKEKIVLTNSGFLKSDNSFSPKAIHNFSVKSMANYHNKMELLKEDLNHYKYRGYKVVILSGTDERGRRLKDTLDRMDVVNNYFEDTEGEIKSNQIIITPGSITGGFEYPNLKFIVLSDKEIFGASKKKTRKVNKKSKSETINISDLNPGNYVVHEVHGIGQYEGIVQLNIQGIKKDYLTIRYKGKDKLYLPVDQMNLIQKYIGSDALKPKVNKLSSGDWSKTKERTKKAVEGMAQELLELYAKREKLVGYSFGPDTMWQNQFEDLFPYEETEGQLKSTYEIKKDMEKPKPMDRLLCGDVGYGKTEVALRAAFKAIMDGKQVAILVPTTILAQQHYNTLVERFSDFPIKIAMLSRFRSPKLQKLEIENLRIGTVDIVVGTHRLLSKDVIFKDLGLLIIDEEQRFGVKHKEILKQIKENVDVLTLTATPIPRTLHMSLIGIRDMSVIEEPPEERYPIQTYVVEWNEQMIRDAILKEIGRGGQVYFLYNRVETIDRMTSKLRELVPEAKFAIGHGQMGEKQLEGVMVDFLSGESDVLVCTTIIETGLDIPNVNTIIIFDADKMGLSQLYQLRGRVGRSNRLAYGYFTYEKDKVLTEVAEKRLRAIKEFTEFGSGFKIAMRDLEIRGAGNMLGLQQHGHIEAVGYDLYVRFLNESIRRLKGEVVEEKIETTIDLQVDGYIPTKYIEDEEQKIEVYKKIAALEDMDDYGELLDELIDRYGDIPKQVENIMEVSYIKSLASKNKIKNILQGEKYIKLEFISTESLSLELIHYLSTEYKKSISFNLSSEPYFNFMIKKDPLGSLKVLIEKINDFHNGRSNI